jgi:hypothetical protein
MLHIKTHGCFCAYLESNSLIFSRATSMMEQTVEKNETQLMSSTHSLSLNVFKTNKMEQARQNCYTTHQCSKIAYLRL